MDDTLDAVLRQVAQGELSPADAEPIIAALSDRTAVAGDARDGADRPRTAPRDRRGPDGRAVRVQVREAGRAVVNLRIPMSWASLASLVPGLSSAHVQRVSDALRNGERGPIVDILDADGDGVIISTE
ncbi:MAG: hypothetical protein R3C32_13720 [Chloroflexota bacterium]